MAYNTSTNLHEPYVHSGSNGTGTPVCILGQNIDTTTAGNGASVQDCMAWFSGTFIVAGLNIGGSAGGDVYYVAAAVAGGGFWQVRSTGELHIA